MLRSVLTILASLLVAAHFLRTGSYVLVATWVAVPLLLLVEAGWARWLRVAMLLLGAGIWVQTAYAIATTRMQLGAPWGRAVAIVSVVALVTVLAAVLELRRTKPA